MNEALIIIEKCIKKISELISETEPGKEVVSDMVSEGKIKPKEE